MARTSRSRGKSPFSMRSGNRSTFKKMGSSSPVRDHETDASGETIEHSEGKWIKKWNPRTQQIDIVKAGDVTTTTTTTSRKGTASREKPHVSTWAEACKGKTSGMSDDGKWDCSRDPDFKKSSEIETKPLSEEDVKVDVDVKKKKCKCMAYNADNKEMGYVHYACDWEGLIDGKHPNCFQRPTGSLCECTDPQGKKHSYPCKSKNCSDCPEPKICGGKKLKCDLNSAELKAKRAECAKKGTVVSRAVKTRWYFSTKTCECKKKTSSGGQLLGDVKEGLKGCIPILDKAGNIIDECGGSDAGKGPSTSMGRMR